MTGRPPPLYLSRELPRLVVFVVEDKDQVYPKFEIHDFAGQGKE